MTKKDVLGMSPPIHTNATQSQQPTFIPNRPRPVERVSLFVKCRISTGAVEYGVYRAPQPNTAPNRGCLSAPDVVDGSGSAAITGPPPLVAGLLPFRATARGIACGAGAAHRPRRQACTATVSATHTGNGCRTDRKALDGTRTTDGAAPTSTNRRWVKVGKPG